MYLKEIHVINFADRSDVNPVYKLNGVEYSDNGLYNDQVANDGIYTSVSPYAIEDPGAVDLIERHINDGLIHISPEFAYNNELSIFLQENNYNVDIDSLAGKFKIPLPKFSLTCKVKWTKSPGTSWYNQSWFGSDCLEFSDCEIEISTSISIGLDDRFEHEILPVSSNYRKNIIYRY